MESIPSENGKVPIVQPTLISIAWRDEENLHHFIGKAGQVLKVDIELISWIDSVSTRSGCESSTLYKNKIFLCMIGVNKFSKEIKENHDN